MKFLLLFIVITTHAFCQSISNRQAEGKIVAEQELKLALSGKVQHNVIDGKSTIIKDTSTAINIAESIVFSVYGKNNIIQQRRYETYLIDNYWVINGTLPTGTLGGTFLIIIDARNGKIVKLTHGK